MQIENFFVLQGGKCSTEIIDKIQDTEYTKIFCRRQPLKVL